MKYLCGVICSLHLILHLIYVSGYVFLHNPRGSNNRLISQSPNRIGSARLFDSDNSPRGGYNKGFMYYIAKSKLSIQWAIRNSCGDETNCDIILQYMCGENLRDGTVEGVIPEKISNNTRFGMHEDFQYYRDCRWRSRNKGLYTADMIMAGDSAMYTRHKDFTFRYGYECPEERDYYPYWHPTPWKDIAIFTTDLSKCDYYKAESQNLKPRYYCHVPPEHTAYGNGYNRWNPKGARFIPITKEECEAFDAIGPKGTKVKGVWKKHSPHDLPSPECLCVRPSRDNHLGSTVDGFFATYDWTVFNDTHENCAMRIRYNVSSAEVPWNTYSDSNNGGPDIWSRVGLSKQKARARRFYVTKRPSVNVFDTTTFNLQLDISPTHFGRVFQDRSHRFSIRKRDEYLGDAEVQNVNVMGKRGNTVQVFPAVEYNYVPDVLHIKNGSYIHFQWTGSNKNPQTYEGQGLPGTDRSNVVILGKRKYSEGTPGKSANYTYGNLGVSYPGLINTTHFLGFPLEIKKKLATLYDVQTGTNMETLDDAKPYYDAGPQQVTELGIFHYMCTRNNNFSYRSQKGKIIVSAQGPIAIGPKGGTLAAGESTTTNVIVPRDAISCKRVVEHALTVIEEQDLDLSSRPPNDAYISGFMYLSSDLEVSPLKPLIVNLELKLNQSDVGFFYSVLIFHSRGNSAWTNIPVEELHENSVRFRTSTGGFFVAVKGLRKGVLAGVIAGAAILVLIIIGCVVFFCCCSGAAVIAAHRASI